MKKFLAGCAMAALATGNAYAQSTGSVDLENKVIVVTGKRTQGVDGIVDPNTSKAKAVLTQQFLSHQTAGQSVDEMINMLPGVSFQNNDPYGGSGGTLNIHGFDASRISQTFDGIPLNDTGNYAIYSNQQLDPELIEQVNVNLGTTDVDSPTAAATGSTVNYRTRNPFDKFSARIEGSAGEYDFMRIFGVVDTGVFTGIGTKAFFSASKSTNENPYNYHAKIDKEQLNAKLYQPIGSNGDFVSVAGNWNRNRNNNFSSSYMRVDLTQSPTNPLARVVGTGSNNRLPISTDERDYSATQPACNVAAATPGAADTPNSCGTAYDRSYNPSNTGNIRVNSRFTLTDKLTLTVDPSYQYVKANGGAGAVKANEGFYSKSGVAGLLTGYIGGQAYFGGRDLNGDGDILDTSTAVAGANLTNTGRGVEMYSSSQTGTHRLGVIASLRYDLTEDQTFRISYSYDHGRHRQTGRLAYLQSNGSSSQYFPIDNPVLDANGGLIGKRDRLSYAILNQGSGEYVGRFFDEKLTINAGLRAPFFTRKLQNNCVTETGGSFVDCFIGEAASQAAFLAANPAYVAPTKKTFHFHKLLPTAGLVYQFAPAISYFASYTKGYQVPGTDNLYQSIGFTSDEAQPKPETSDNFETGLRYTTGKLQGTLSGWYTKFHNRLSSAYDAVLDTTIYRNLGNVEKYGIDASIAYKPIKQITVYGFGSYLKSKIDNDVQLARCTVITGIGPCTSTTNYVYAATQGKRENGAPVYLIGGRVEGNLGPVTLGIQAKRTGKRYVNDQNQPIVQCTGTFVNSNQCVTSSTNVAPATQYQVFPSYAKPYTLTDIDVRFSLKAIGMNDKSWLQLNVTNVFNVLWIAGFQGSTQTTTIPNNAYIGSPRTISGTVNIAF